MCQGPEPGAGEVPGGHIQFNKIDNKLKKKNKQIIWLPAEGKVLRRSAEGKC